MKSKISIGILVYVFIDWLIACVSWTALFIFRKTYIEGYSWTADFPSLFDVNFYIGIVAIPISWLFLYFLWGTYGDIFRKSRLSELSTTFLQSIVGVIVIFFVLLLDDMIGGTYKNYYKTVGMLFVVHTSLTLFFRLITLSIARRLVNRGYITYRSLLVGNGQNALELYTEITGQNRYLGYEPVGYLATAPARNGIPLKRIGGVADIEQAVVEHAVDEVLIALDESEKDLLHLLLQKLGGVDVVIKIVPDLQDILAGSVKMNYVIGAILIEIYPQLMPFWQKVLKRVIDIFVSLLLLIILSPVLLLCIIMIPATSKGPVLYSQERIGRKGKPFRILKFRSMFTDAEKTGPSLSKSHDPRITSWGKIMRKWRLDELPQLLNVLWGEMSLVGPRPERQFFIEQILPIAPAYKYLHKVKPGITSWGMVKFGYAENVEQMIKRMKYDLLYIENMSLSLDFKIMIYTILTVIQGKGK